MPLSFYPDAGVCERNPSPIGGAWAVIVCDDGTEVVRLSGKIYPSDVGMETIENNLAETIAVAQALQCLAGMNDIRPGSAMGATIYGDNLNAIRRGDTPAKTSWNGVPAIVKGMIEENRAKLPNVKFVLLGGHPTRKELADGFRKDGKPCSVHNKNADLECQAVCAEMTRAFNGVPSSG